MTTAIAEGIQTNVGPKLLVFGIEVRSWLGTEYDRHCMALVRQINDAARSQMLVDAKKVEALKVWYAVFTSILDVPQAGETTEQLVENLRKLREMIQKEMPAERTTTGRQVRKIRQGDRRQGERRKGERRKRRW